MIAAEASTEAPVEERSGDTIIYPQGSPGAVDAGGASRTDGGGAGVWLAGALLLAAGGGWLLLRRRGLPLKRLAAGERLIAIEETKSIGGRQYLVVARCEGRRMLLGVTNGRIQLLTPLDDVEPAGAEEDAS